MADFGIQQQDKDRTVDILADTDRLTDEECRDAWNYLIGWTGAMSPGEGKEWVDQGIRYAVENACAWSRYRRKVRAEIEAEIEQQQKEAE